MGLGAIPEGLVFEYLARITSLLYAFAGGLCWVLAGDVRNYARVIRYVGVAFLAMVCLSLVMLLPHRSDPFFWWIIVDAVSAAGFGAAILLLTTRLPRA